MKTKRLASLFIMLAMLLALVTPAAAAEDPPAEAPRLPVLFENGQWAPELGEITVHTPGGTSTWAYENGSIRMTNGVPASKSVAFRWVFENLVDMRGYDAVVMELEEAPAGWFGAILRFRIDQDACWAGNDHTNVIRMESGTNVNVGGMVGMSAGNWDLERLRGVGGLPDYGQTVKIKKIYLEGDGVYEPVTINSDAQNLMDIIPPRTGNIPVRSITSSSQYSATVEWSPDHAVFQPDTVYMATVTLTPKPGWKLEGVPANWFRIYYPTGGAVYFTHDAGSGVLTHTFPATTPIEPYPEPTQFVALTFDDVYLSDTEALVDTLNQLGIKGTFFANGINLEKSLTDPAKKRALDKLVAGGHEIGSHAYQHERYDNNADEDVTRENFSKNQELIRQLTGQTPRWIRIPYASHGSMSLRVAGEFGLTNLRGLATNDWDFPNSPSRLVNTILTATGNNSLRDGQIYVCHNQPGQTNTIKALPEIVHELRSRGFGFMTASELAAHKNFTALPGINYNNFFQNVITITTQPAAPPAEDLIQGNIRGSLSITASASLGTVTYQWYSNTRASTSGGTAIAGETNPTFALPADLTEGTYYYYCRVSSDGASNVNSSVVTVTVTSTQPKIPVLFENGQWAAELGEITVHTPRGSDGHYMWSYEDGMIRLTNDISGDISRNSIPFRWVFQNTIDIRGYDAVVIELEEVPAGAFLRKLRFRIDEDNITCDTIDTATVRMTSFTDSQRLRGVGALPSFGEVVRIKKIYLEGDGIIDTPATITRREIRDIIPPRTGNTPVREITTSPQYTGTVEWSPNHEVFQENTVYTATITLTPRPGWTFEGVPANWFRLYDITGNDAANTLTHAAGATVLTKTFAATRPVVPYPDPTQFVVLSFDDTISPETNDLLDVLDSLGIKANFFAIGINLEKANRMPEYARALARLRDGGFEVGNHTWQHERWTRTSSEIRLSDWTKTQEYIKDLFGEDPKWIRFPYNDQNAAAVMDAGSLNLCNLWGFDTNDWSIDRSASYLINRVLNQTSANNMARDGQIYVHHDHYDNQNSTRYALPEIAHYLRSRGIDFMTASELSSRNNITLVPGSTYNNFFLPSRITISTQPANLTYVMEGSITASLSVSATVTPSATPGYQWYFTTTATPTVWEAIEGATDATCAVPANLTEGKYYFYCVASAPNAASVTSNVVTVIVTPDKTELAAQIESAQQVDQPLYTSESIAAFNEALSAAINVYNNNDATKAEADTALANLTAAMDALIRRNQVSISVAPNTILGSEREITFRVSVEYLQGANVLEGRIKIADERFEFADITTPFIGDNSIFTKNLNYSGDGKTAYFSLAQVGGFADAVKMDIACITIRLKDGETAETLEAAIESIDMYAGCIDDQGQHSSMDVPSVIIDSTAHTNVWIPSEVRGDFDGSSDVTGADLSIAMSYFGASIEDSDWYTSGAWRVDYNSDGVIDIEDLTFEAWLAARLVTF